ncbi:MAG: 5'/3'-nucleotidase SurE [Dehalococcoidia bacterium]|nr:MAG: 5'/3'-nucleotidase SurE [Dehalococcoidia bacterium]
MILISNDDGIFAPGLWTLATELKKIDSIVVVAPDREQSATGTSVTLRQPLRVRKVAAIVPDVNTYGVEGTPSDSVILALEKLATTAEVVVSGINSGQNLGDDVLISGTVGAALQGYLRNLPAIAVSVGHSDTENLETAANLVRLLVGYIKSGTLPRDIFLNVNLPDVPLPKIKGIVMTQPTHKTHIDSVEEGNDGRRDYFWLVRRKLEHQSPDSSDIWAVEHGYISITPLHTTFFRRPAPDMGAGFCKELLCELKSNTL